MSIPLTINRAFNLGSDARIKGKPPQANPFEGYNSTLAYWWRQGWYDAERYWGRENRAARQLPPVREDAA